MATAALNYFNKSLDELTIAEAAFLAALPKAPNNYHPRRHYKKAKARRNWVINRMFEEGYVNADDAILAKKEEFNLQTREETQVVKADYFAEEVRRFLMHTYGSEALYQGGLTVRTTLDPRIQGIADKALRNGLIAYDRRHGYRGPYRTLIWNEANQANWVDMLEKTPPPPGPTATPASPWAPAQRPGSSGGSPLLY